MDKYFVFKSDKLKDPDVILNRYDDKSGSRFYWSISPDGSIKIYAGVTSIIAKSLPESWALTNWKVNQGVDYEKISNMAATYGTLMHLIFAEWFQKHMDNISELLTQAEKFCVDNGASKDMPKKDLLAFVRWVEEYDVVPMLIETMMTSEAIAGQNYAMTIDLLCEMTVTNKHKEMIQEGEYKIGEKKGQPKMVEKTVETKQRILALVDFKSNFFSKDSKSFYDGHKYQLLAARRAVWANFPELTGTPIYMANFSPLEWRKEPNYEFKMHNLDEKDEELFDLYMKIAQLRGLFEPQGSKLVVTSIENSHGYMFLDYKQLIEYDMNKQKESLSPPQPVIQQ